MKTDPSKAIDGEILAPGADLPQEQVVLVELADLKSETREHAQLINENWRRAVSSIIETGRAIKKARTALKKDPKELDLLDEYLRTRVGISISERSKLERIGTNEVFALEGNANKLPPAVATLYKLTQIPVDRLKDALDDDKISSAITLGEVDNTYFLKKVKAKKPSFNPRFSISGNLKGKTVEEVKRIKELVDKINALLKNLNRKGI